MPNTSVVFMGSDSKPKSILAIDTGQSDGQGHQLYLLGMSLGGTNATPADQASTNAYADVAGSSVDTITGQGIAYTIVNSGANSITWQVLGANRSDFSDSQVVKAPAAVAAAGTDTYTVNPAPYRYYKVQAKDTVGGNHGTATVAWTVR